MLKMIYLTLAICVTFFCNIANAQVTLQTGTPEYNIPVFSYKNERNELSLDVKLGYTAGHGIKVSQLASNIGLGWSLQCGGSIIRQTNGLPDDQFEQKMNENEPYVPVLNPLTSEALTQPYYSHILEKDVFAAGYLNTSQNSSTPVDIAFQPIYIFGSVEDQKRYQHRATEGAMKDTELDYFSFDFNGYAGTFIINKATGQGVTLEDSRLKIIPLYENIPDAMNLRTRISGFKITTPEGINYYFKGYELSSLLYRRNEIDPATTKPIIEAYDANGDPIMAPNFGGVQDWAPNSTFATYTFRKIKSLDLGQYVINKWMLTEIENPRINEKIVFQYEDYNLDFIADFDITANKTQAQISGSDSYEKIHITKSEVRVKAKAKRINNILFPDGRSLDIIYETTGRLDHSQEKAIKIIQVRKGEDLLMKKEFGYKYFTKKTVKPENEIFTDEYSDTRLCLSSVKDIGRDGSPASPFIFDYYLPEEGFEIPRRLSYLGTRDYWGYPLYTSHFNNYYDESKANVLPTFRYLLDDQLEARKQSGDYSKIMMLKKIQTPSGGVFEYKYEPNDCINVNLQGTNIGYGGVRVSKFIESYVSNSGTPFVTEYKYQKDDGASSGWGAETPKNFYEQTLRQYKAQSTGYAIYGTLVRVLTDPSNIDAGMNGSMRRHIKVGDHKPKPQLTAFEFQLIQQLAFTFIINVFEPSFREYPSKIYGIDPISESNPLPFQYSQVTVLNYGQSTNPLGKTVSKFRSTAGNGLEIDPSFSMPFSAKQRSLRWRYGKPISNTIFDATGRKIRETLYSYEDVISELDQSLFVSKKYMPFKFHSANAGFSYISIPESDIAKDVYYYKTGRSYLKETIVREFDANDFLMENITKYDYNLTNYAVKKVINVKSDGTQIESLTYFPEDYNDTDAGIAALKMNNMVNEPIASEIWIKKYGNRYLTDMSTTKFGTVNSIIRPFKIYQLETKAPISESVIGNQDPNSLIRNTNYIKEQLNNTYNDAGNLISINKKGSTVSYLYDELKENVIAEVVNASAEDIHYTSFEDSFLDGFSGVSGPFQTVSNALTGSKVFIFPQTGSVIEASINSAKKYILSFWTQNGSLTVYAKINGAPPTAQQCQYYLPSKNYLNTKTGWTYYEYEISNGDNICISNTSNFCNPIDNPPFPMVSIDEVRVYPKGTYMTTHSYQRFVGEVSSCDVNNKVTYSEYDGFNRLKITRDMDRNILSKTCYNEAGLQVDCFGHSSIPVWQVVPGVKRCAPCTVNSNYFNGIEENREIDVNPYSDSYNQYRWASIGLSASCVPGVWQNTSTPLRCKVDNCGFYTGEQEQEQLDINPCSNTFNQIRWVPVGINNIVCTPNSPSCTSEGYKYINCICEPGIKIYIDFVILNNVKYCVYRYEFSDGSVSDNYYQQSDIDCRNM